MVHKQSVIFFDVVCQVWLEVANDLWLTFENHRLFNIKTCIVNQPNCIQPKTFYSWANKNLLATVSDSFETFLVSTNQNVTQTFLKCHASMRQCGYIMLLSNPGKGNRGLRHPPFSICSRPLIKIAALLFAINLASVTWKHSRLFSGSCCIRHVFLSEPHSWNQFSRGFNFLH